MRTRRSLGIAAGQAAPSRSRYASGRWPSWKLLPSTVRQQILNHVPEETLVTWARSSNLFSFFRSFNSLDYFVARGDPTKFVEISNLEDQVLAVWRPWILQLANQYAHSRSQRRSFINHVKSMIQASSRKNYWNVIRLIAENISDVFADVGWLWIDALRTGNPLAANYLIDVFIRRKISDVEFENDSCTELLALHERIRDVFIDRQVTDWDDFGLAVASFYGHLDAMRTILDARIPNGTIESADEEKEFGFSAAELSFAHVKALELLYNHGIQYKESLAIAFVEASKHGFVDSVAFLLDHSVNPNTLDQDVDESFEELVQDVQHTSIIRLFMERGYLPCNNDAIEFLKQCRKQNLKVVEILIETYPQLLQEPHALYNAIAFGQVSLVKLLLEHGAISTEYPSRYDVAIDAQIPHESCLQIMDLLLEHKVPPSNICAVFLKKCFEWEYHDILQTFLHVYPDFSERLEALKRINSFYQHEHSTEKKEHGAWTPPRSELSPNRVRNEPASPFALSSLASTGAHPLDKGIQVARSRVRATTPPRIADFYKQFLPAKYSVSTQTTEFSTQTESSRQSSATQTSPYVQPQGIPITSHLAAVAPLSEQQSTPYMYAPLDHNALYSYYSVNPAVLQTPDLVTVPGALQSMPTHTIDKPNPPPKRRKYCRREGCPDPDHCPGKGGRKFCVLSRQENKENMVPVPATAVPSPVPTSAAPTPTVASPAVDVTSTAVTSLKPAVPSPAPAVPILAAPTPLVPSPASVPSAPATSI